MRLLKACGFWKVTKDSIRIVTNQDFCAYYRWLFTRGNYNTIKLELPMHGGHIGVISQKIHKRDCSDYFYLNGRSVNFEYDIEGNMGGFSKGFKNFWLNVYCVEAEEILREFGLDKKTDGFSLLHHTIGNNKYLKNI